MGAAALQGKDFFIDFFLLVRPLARLCSEGGFGSGSAKPPRPHLSLPSLAYMVDLLCLDRSPPLAAPCHKPTAQTGVTSGLMEGGKFYVWGFFFLTDISKFIRI